MANDKPNNSKPQASSSPKPINVFDADNPENQPVSTTAPAAPPIETPGGKPGSPNPSQPQTTAKDKPSEPPSPAQDTSIPKPPTSADSPPQSNTGASPSTATPPTQKTPPPIPVKKSPLRFVIPLLVILILGGLIYFALTRLFPGVLDRDTTTDPETRPPIELTYWGLWEPAHIMNDIITDFNLTHPHIVVNYQQQSITDYRERLQSALQSGSGPDIFRYHLTWVPMLGNSLATAPNNIISADEFNQTFYPSASEWLKTSQGIVGIPLMFDGLGLFYNRDIFEAAGLSPPSTWEELRRTANQLTIKTSAGNIQRSGIALGTTGNIDHWSDILGLMLLQNGANPAMPNTQSGQGAITFYTIFSTRDRIWDETLPNSTYAFAIERAAMILAPSWHAHEILESNAEIRFAIAPVPQLPDTNITWASYWAEGVSAQTSRDKQQAAWELLQFLSSKETLRQFYTRASQERLFGEPFSRVDLADQLLSDPYVGAYISTAPQAQTWFLNDRTFDNGLNDRIIKYYEDAINAVNEGTPPAQALETTEQGINQIFSQFNLR